MRVQVKRWGKENIFVNNDLYCGKFLHFKPFHPCSLHMHRDKTETFYVVKGNFDIVLVDMVEESFETVWLREGQTLDIKPYLYHRIMGIREENVLLEVSTHDEPEDSYRFNDQEDTSIIHNKEFAKKIEKIANPPKVDKSKDFFPLLSVMQNELEKTFCDGHHPDYYASELEMMIEDCSYKEV